MNKNWTRIAAAILLLTLCTALIGCRREVAEDTKPVPGTQASTDALPTDDTKGTETATVPATTDGGTSIGTDRPDISSDTEVGSGRVETGNTDATVPPTTKPPVATDPAPTETQPDDGLSLNYTQYMALSNAQQQELYDKYFSDDPLAFAAWFQKLKAEYEDETPEIIATGPVDIGDYITP